MTGGASFQIEEDDGWNDDAFFAGVDADAMAAAHREDQRRYQSPPAWNQYRQGSGARGHAGGRAVPHPHGVGGLLDRLPTRSGGGTGGLRGGRGGGGGRAGGGLRGGGWGRVYR